MTGRERQALIALARAAMTARVRGGAAAAPNVARPLADPGAAFVTLRRHAKLRGCVGYTERDRPLAEGSCGARRVPRPTTPAFRP